MSCQTDHLGGRQLGDQLDAALHSSRQIIHFDTFASVSEQHGRSVYRPLIVDLDGRSQDMNTVGLSQLAYLDIGQSRALLRRNVLNLRAHDAQLL